MRRSITLVIMLVVLRPTVDAAAFTSQPALAAALPVRPLRMLAPAAAEVANTRRGYVGVAVYALDSDTLYSFQGSRAFPMFSTVKVPIMLAVLDRAVREGRRVSQREQVRIEAMITVSDNAAATVLLADLGGAAAVEAHLRRIGITQTHVHSPAWGTSTTTAQDMARLLAKLQNCTILVPRLCRYALTTMQSVDSGQNWGVSAGLPAGATVALKNGWFPDDDGWGINSIGLVTTPGKRYAIAVFTNPDPSLGYGIATIEQIARHIYPEVP